MKNSNNSRQQVRRRTCCTRKISGILFLLFGLPVISLAQFTYSTSWIGNTWGTGDASNGGKWVQLNSSSLYVSPDGTCYTNSYWEEGHRATQMYKNGEIAGRLDDSSVGQYGAVGGYEITGDGTYIWAHIDDWGAVPRIKRYNLNGTRANWKDASNADTHVLSLKNHHNVHGLAVDKVNQKLYVSLNTSDSVLVYNTANLNAAPSVIRVSRPGRSIVASDGTLWLLQEANAANQAKILHFSATGSLLSQQITGPSGWSPTALCFDLTGRLMVADNGPQQNIKIYTNLTNNAPTLAATFGNSIYSGTQGQITSSKFGSSGLAGIGIDSNGNIYIALNGADPYSAHDHGMGFVLESRTAANALNWRLLGLEFVDGADVDQSSVSGDMMDVYTKDTRYTVDLSKTVAGTQYTYKGHTVNRFKYPNDARFTDMEGNWTHPATPWIRTIGGRKIMFVTDMWGDRLRIYRFNAATDGEVAIPCGLFSRDKIWYDSNGNGNPEEGETLTGPGVPGGGGEAFSYHIDSNGDVWTGHNGGGKAGVRRLIFQGIDANGVPKWDYGTGHTQYWEAPAPFGEIHRAIYVPSEDALYITGYARSVDPDHYWNGPNWGKKWLGSVVGRYSNWSKGNRTVTWTTVLDEYNRGPISIATAGDYVFIGYAFFGTNSQEGWIKVYKASDGAYVGKFRAGPEVASTSGTMDILYGITAYKRSNGEYIILAEEDWHAKVLMYRWRPDDGRNYLANPSFEANNAFAQTPASWSTWAGAAGTSADADYAESGGYNSNYRLTHWKSTAYEVSTYQNITGLANGTYTLKAWVKSSGGQTSATMEVNNYGGAKRFVNIPASSAYVQISLSNIQVSNGQCTVSFYSNAPAGKWMHVDQVEFTASSPAGRQSFEVKNSPDASLTLYPVPAQDVLRVKAPAAIRSLQLTTLTGQPLLTPYTLTGEREAEVKVGACPNGMVLLRVRTAQGTATRKVVVQK